MHGVSFRRFLVRQLGWSFTETAVAFSITIFSLAMSAAWAWAAAALINFEIAIADSLSGRSAMIRS